MKRIQQFEKAKRCNMSASGVWWLVVKKDVLSKYSLMFDERFGAGTDCMSGEDTIFLMNMINRGVALYRSPIDIAGIDQSESSWIKTINDSQYYETSAMVIHSIYPKLSRLIAIRSAFKASRRDENAMSFIRILRCYYRGIQNSSQ